MNDEALLRIGELSRRTGVSVDALRAWERRYGLLRPARSSGGYRLYTDSDEQRVRSMKRLLAEGLRAAQAAEVAKAPPVARPETVRVPTLFPGQLRARLRDSLEALDEEGANRALDDAVGAFSIDALLRDVVLSTMREIGARWHEGQITVAEEHFATNVVRGRLLGLARGWGSGDGPLAVLACPPAELHDLGLIAFGLTLNSRGWRIAYLGQDTPVETTAATASRLNAKLVVLAAVERARFDAAAKLIAELAAAHPVLLAGEGADSGLARSLGGRFLDGGPVEAAVSAVGRGQSAD